MALFTGTSASKYLKLSWRAQRQRSSRHPALGGKRCCFFPACALKEGGECPDIGKQSRKAAWEMKPGIWFSWVLELPEGGAFLSRLPSASPGIPEDAPGRAARGDAQWAQEGAGLIQPALSPVLFKQREFIFRHLKSNIFFLFHRQVMFILGNSHEQNEEKS